LLTNFFLAAAILFQVLAAAMALSLIRVTGKSLAWILISAALCLMVARRIMPFIDALARRPSSGDQAYEFIGMLLSACMAAGVALIKPIFREVFESERRLAESERRYRGYFELPIVGFATVSEDRRWISVNDRLCEMVAAQREELVGATVDDRTVAGDGGAEPSLAGDALSGAIEGYVIDKRMTRGRGGEVIWVSQAARYVPGRDGAPGYFVLIIQDISERKAYESRLSGSLAEKEVLLRELHHRTKNNMQVICSLLNLECAKCDDPKLAEEFHTIEGRIQSMSLVHEKLYRSRDLSRIDLAEYIGDLVELLMYSYGAKPERIRVSKSLASVLVPIDIAIPCGLILHEVISNSLKHAFPNDRAGCLDLRLESTEDGHVRIAISDDGIGLAKDFDLRTCAGMGIKTIFALSEQINGEIAFDTSRGVTCTLCFLSSAEPDPDMGGPEALIASARGAKDPD
jgi:PAS domain S-box-containing protein